MTGLHPLILGDVALGPPVFLAPMAGITDLPFRRAVARYGPIGLMVSEMVGASEMVTPRPSSRAAARAELEDGDQPVSVQIAGREAAPMAETARIIADMGARIIDINMGCPARKVTGGLSGAALMRDLDHALRLLEAVIGAVPHLPVTLKMRLGWDQDMLNAPALAQRAASAGARMLTVHGRTRAQFYTGSADWHAVRRVSEAVPHGPDMPFIVVNGDIACGETARAALAASGAAAVMVGRAAQGAPWRPAQIAHAMGFGPAPVIPYGPALAAAVAEHYDDMLAFYGLTLGARVARKHLGWWAAAAGIPEARADLVSAASPAETFRVIAGRFADAPGDGAMHQGVNEPVPA